MAEVLIVIAIIAVLTAVAFIAVNSHQRSLGQLERDGIAKEIFVAAQNHLTVAYGEGYLGLKVPESGSGETNPFGTKADDGSYYFVVNGTGDAANATVFDQILPFGSVDETVRGGGSYIIHYQQETGLMLDVFYCTTHGSPTSFNHSFFDHDDFATVMSLAGEGKKSDRRTYEAGGNSILGWYGGTEQADIPKVVLQSPTIKVVNAEKLYVEITNPNTSVTDSDGNAINVSVRLLIKGLSSNTQHYINVTDTSRPIILDDITSSGGHFSSRRFDDMTVEESNGFIPGENITIQAVAYCKGALSNIAYSNKATTNSLFASIGDSLGNTDGILETAYISNFRHLENLDQQVSKLSNAQTVNDSKLERFRITAAVQTSDMSWNTFKSKTNGEGTIIYSFSNSNLTSAGSYYPIDPSYDYRIIDLTYRGLSYNGQSHRISDVKVTGIQNSGLFGSTTKVSEIKNLELFDFSVAGTDSAGALAGTLTNCTVTNVLARNSSNATTVNITATGSAGGLIGSATDCTVKYSAAALIVNGSTAAGGLIGTASEDSGSMLVAGCYSGGHTDPNTASYYIGGTASYDDNTGVLQNGIYNVRTTGTGGVAGGLIGVSGPTVINNSYSTCSVNGTKAGGFIGSGSGNITNSYCTGLVGGTTIGSFAGEYSGTAGTCNYFEIINEIPPADSSAYTYLLPVYYSGSGVANDYPGISALDATEGSYNFFVGNTWKTARAYDPVLVKYYQGKYNLKSIPRLDSSTPANYFVNTHYGDWPAPEIFFLNTPAA